MNCWLVCFHPVKLNPELFLKILTQVCVPYFTSFLNGSSQRVVRSYRESEKEASNISPAWKLQLLTAYHPNGMMDSYWFSFRAVLFYCCSHCFIILTPPPADTPGMSTVRPWSQDEIYGRNLTTFLLVSFPCRQFQNIYIHLLKPGWAGGALSFTIKLSINYVQFL